MKKRAEKKQTSKETGMKRQRKDKRNGFDSRLNFLIDQDQKIPKIKVPDLTSDNPYVVKVADSSNPRLMVINSPLIGALPQENPHTDPFKNALHIAEVKNADAIIIAGNLIYFITQQYGSTYPYKAQASGIPTNPKILNEAYPKSVIEDSGDIETRVEKGKPVFMPVRTRLDLVLDMVKKEFVDANDKPVYSGPLLITFGSIEEALAMQHTNERLRIDVQRERTYAQRKIKELYRELAAEKKLKAEANSEKIEKVEREIEDFRTYEQFAIMGNVAPDHINRTTDSMISYIIWRYEKDIPNAKVISIGDAYLKAGNKLIEVTYEKSGESLNDGFAGKIRDVTYSRIKNNPGSSIPDVILGAGLNPTFRNLLISHRVREREATLEDVKLCHAIQLTTCINDGLYREVARKRVRVKDDLTRLAKSDSFTAGVLWIEWINDIFSPEFWSGECLVNEKNFENEASLRTMVTYGALLHERLYFLKEGCTHYGARYMATYPSPNDSKGRYIKLHYQVALEMLNKLKAPIAGYQHDGDACHWINYETWKEEHDDWIGLEDFTRELTRLETLGVPFEERIKKLKMTAIMNDIRSGIINPEKQLPQYVLSLEPYLDFWAGIIEYCRDNGIEFRGKFSAIVQGRGNHNEHSFPKGSKVEFSEAKLIRSDMVANLFKKYPSLSDLIEKNFTAPHMGKLGFANGVMAVIPDKKKRGLGKDDFMLQQDFYSYAVKMKHKQGSSKSKDNMSNMLRAFAKQGTANAYEAGRMTVNLAGDDHFGGLAITRNAFHFKTGCQTFENEFGKRFDFPEQNLFSGIWSVPIGGPSRGPLSWVFLDYGLLRKYANAPFPIDRAKLFRGALALESTNKKGNKPSK
ncbi:MAG: hypothetical protein A3H69_05445 [Candidatus Sungbacteria bacterium RIFCSPLOWO2_02_FULL_47_9]|nr:MAG: hypothetical protein A3D57_04580 [Candidatus Sungbacteria bacterium RIFCSPHIGHO2_02_FULL_46_12]OHA04653.1 MAG: hypothetical protein A3A28_04480 [Candidatus Sungbacteria bacterium RIFCSPLOWO2_01_FULL_47_32]OHA08905.1 MAG: hypothetical protein A3H69_05445 [Candidatus Sungbacteria bacterium RIFCSPLOWO2_02_FULL_47_9]